MKIDDDVWDMVIDEMDRQLANDHYGDCNGYDDALLNLLKYLRFIDELPHGQDINQVLSDLHNSSNLKRGIFHVMNNSNLFWRVFGGVVQNSSDINISEIISNI